MPRTRRSPPSASPSSDPEPELPAPAYADAMPPPDTDDVDFDVDVTTTRNGRVESTTPEPESGGGLDVSREGSIYEDGLFGLQDTTGSSLHDSQHSVSDVSDPTREDDAPITKPGRDFTGLRPLRPLLLRVSSPQKTLEGSAAFVTYLVSTDAAEDQLAERVRRRYSDFAQLYTHLCAEYPACAVPPLPDRSRLEYIAGDRFSPEFTAKRAASLERFLFRITQHPELAKSRALALFLAPRDLSSGPGKQHRSPSIGSGFSASPGSGSDGEPSMFDTISDSLINAFTKVKYQSKEMADARERADRFEHNVVTVDKAIVRVSRDHQELATDLDDIRKQSQRLAEVEPTLEDQFGQLAATAKVLNESTTKLRQGVDSQFAGALKDMAHYVQALKGMLKQREQRQIDYEALVEYLTRTETELAAAEQGLTPTTGSFLRTKVNDLRGVDKEQARAARIQKLRVRIQELRTEVDHAKQLSIEFESVAKREVRVFERIEELELQTSLQGLAERYIEYFQQVLKECKAIEEQL